MTLKSSDMELRDTYKYKKAKMKMYADERNNATESKLTVGNKVLVQQPKENRLSTPFDRKPYKIMKKNGIMVTVRSEDKSITRDSMFF